MEELDLLCVIIANLAILAWKSRLKQSSLLQSEVAAGTKIRHDDHEQRKKKNCHAMGGGPVCVCLCGGKRGGGGGRGESGESPHGSQERDGHDGLAEPHLICQDHIAAVDPCVEEPVETLQLVGVQIAPLQEVWGLWKAAACPTSCCLSFCFSSPCLLPSCRTEAVTTKCCPSYQLALPLRSLRFSMYPLLP